ncbi:hypothetical protein ACXDF8_16540 [Mycolicibacterium sp. CBM1]
MPAARSFRTTTVALAGAAAIAAAPLIPAQDAPLRSVHLPDVQLTDLTIPALGAIPYQIGINALGDILAVAPILIGSTQQCTVCLGPNTPAPDARYAPFTGWGLVGLAKGLITSPVALVSALQAGKDVGQALGAALLDIQVPITNTVALLISSRVPYGGFGLQATLERLLTASRDALVGGFDIVAQALITGPVTVAGGVVAGATAFAGTLAQTGDVITALNAGRAPIQESVTAALNDLTFKIDTSRAKVYDDLTSGPDITTSPIPTVPAATADAVTAAAGPVTKVVESTKAVPGTTAAAAQQVDGTDNGDTAQSGSATHSRAAKHSGLGGSKRPHRGDSDD